MIGREPPISVNRPHLDGQRLVAQGGEIVAGQYLLCIDTDQRGQAFDNNRIVARQHLELDAGRREPRNGRGGGRFRRVGEYADSFEDQFGFVAFLDVSQRPRPGTRCDGNRAKAVAGVREYPVGGRHAVACTHVEVVGACAPFGAQRQHRLGCSFDNQQRSLRSRGQGRSQAAREVERVPAGDGPTLRGVFGTPDQCGIERAAITTELRGDRAEQGSARIILTNRVETACERDFSRRKRTGLVGTQHRHGAKVMDRRKAFDDDLAPGHPHRAARQGDGGDHRQQFRRQADGERDGEHQ